MEYTEVLQLLLSDEELTPDQRRAIGKLIARYDHELSHYKAQYAQVEAIVRGHENHVKWLEDLESTFD